MSQGTPPRNTLQEYSGSLLFRGGSWPLQVNVASFTAADWSSKSVLPCSHHNYHMFKNIRTELQIGTCSLPVQAGLPLDTKQVIWRVEHVSTGPWRASTPAARDSRGGGAGTGWWSQGGARVLWVQTGAQTQQIFLHVGREIRQGRRNAQSRLLEKRHKETLNQLKTFDCIQHPYNPSRQQHPPSCSNTC